MAPRHTHVHTHTPCTHTLYMHTCTHAHKHTCVIPSHQTQDMLGTHLGLAGERAEVQVLTVLHHLAHLGAKQ